MKSDSPIECSTRPGGRDARGRAAAPNDAAGLRKYFSKKCLERAGELNRTVGHD